MERPKSPEMTAGEGSGYGVAIALIALAQFGTLDRWGSLAAVICAALVACCTVLVTGRIRAVRNGTEQVRLEQLSLAAVEPDMEWEQGAADLADLDEGEPA